MVSAEVCELDIGLSLQGEVVHTPVTPVILDALTSLQDLIQQDAHALDESNKQRLQRRLQKFSNAAEISFAERALQQDQIRCLAAKEAKKAGGEAKKAGKEDTKATREAEEVASATPDAEETAAGKRERGRTKTTQKRKSFAEARCAGAKRQGGADERNAGCGGCTLPQHLEEPPWRRLLLSLQLTLSHFRRMVIQTAGGIELSYPTILSCIMPRRGCAVTLASLWPSPYTVAFVPSLSRAFPY